MRVATWNLEWAKPGTRRHGRGIEQLDSIDADVVVTTEHSIFDWDRYPHRIDAGPDWGYETVDGRRKVIAWSKQPWHSVTIGEEGAALGRLVRGVTSAGDAAFTLIGVCIPWRDAHVRTGRRDRAVWDEHREFLGPLSVSISSADDRMPAIVAGDFNQRFPRSRQPVKIFDEVAQALSGVRVLTGGDFECGKLIDHVAASDHVTAASIDTWPKVIDGHRLTDHSGVAVELVQSATV